MLFRVGIMHFAVFLSLGATNGARAEEPCQYIPERQMVICPQVGGGGGRSVRMGQTGFRCHANKSLPPPISC